MRQLLSTLSISLITLNLIFWSIGLIVLGVLKFVFRSRAPRIDRAMDWIYRRALALDDAWLRRVLRIDWTEPIEGLDASRTYLVLSNHVSWSDILILQSIIVGRGPLLKFLVKKELARIPILGVIFWAFDFPLLRRRSARGESDELRQQHDVAALREACAAIQRTPAALMNFAEGTRFSEEKRQASKSVYAHLLRPRVGGFATLVEALGSDLAGVVDVTLVYPREHTFWTFLSGAVRHVDVDVEILDPRELPPTRAEMGEWLDARWRRKDELIEGARSVARASSADTKPA